jgi:cytochrome c biogenesis protein CcmG/thiol:disulfide interchange protein DsbE
VTAFYTGKINEVYTNHIALICRNDGDNMRNKLLLAAIVILALLPIYQALTQSGKELSKPGYRAPSFKITDLDGNMYTMDRLKGKPVLINFWASWCEPCRKEMPDLIKLYGQYKDRIEIVAVNVTARDSSEPVQAFVQEYRLPFPVLLDNKGEVADQYHIAPIPTTYFVDKNGVIAERQVGVTDYAALEAKINRLLQ